MATTCDFCGRSAAEDAACDPPLAWTTSVENGRTKIFCEQCSRENLRSIEAKLDSDWW